MLSLNATKQCDQSIVFANCSKTKDSAAKRILVIKCRTNPFNQPSPFGNPPLAAALSANFDNASGQNRASGPPDLELVQRLVSCPHAIYRLTSWNLAIGGRRRDNCVGRRWGKKERGPSEVPGGKSQLPNILPAFSRSSAGAEGPRRASDFMEQTVSKAKSLRQNYG